jgi:hypothetical protein
MAVEASTPLGYPRAATAVTSAIRNAAAATGTSFSYLLATAKIESDLDPTVTMKSSSATGLFQFIDQTWLGTLKQAGPAFGYGDYADAIARDSSGRYSVSDPEMRREIMKLRNDPSANAVMAGALTQNNTAVLTRRIGRQPTESELYIAHFLGVGGAAKLIQLTASNGQASAADAFPAAAHANRPIFYDRQGNARSVSGVYSEIVRRFKVASVGVSPLVASAQPRPLPPAALASSPAPRAAPPVTDVAAITRAFAFASAPPSTASVAATAAPIAPAPPTFNSLFSDQDRRTAVDPTVVALWSVPASPPQTSGAPAAPQRAAAPAANSTTSPASFDLFQDLPPNGRALFGGSS